MKITAGNPDVLRRPDARVLSETNALKMIRQLAEDSQTGTLKEARDNAATIAAYADSLLGQLKSGIHVNPPLAVFMANPSKLMSHDVQLIVYRHVEDRRFYAHQFGGEDVNIRRVRGHGQVIVLNELPERTGVDMRTDGRIVQLSRPDGKPLSKDFR